jgi:hypothetical protein
MRHTLAFRAAYSSSPLNDNMRPPAHRTNPPIDTSDSELDGDPGSETEDEAGGEAFQAVLDDVLRSDNPFDDSDDDEEHERLNYEPEMPEDEHQNYQNPTLCALEYLANHGLTLAELLDNVVFGDKSIRGKGIVKSACLSLFKSSVIPLILERIRKPPGMQLRGKAHKAAKSEVENWALETSTELLRKELVQYTATTKAPEAETEVVSEDSLKEMTFDALSQQIKHHAPRLNNLLSEICLATRRGRK